MRNLLTLGLILALCLPSLADTPPPITLGGLFNLTGRQSTLDVPCSQGAQLAVEQANATAPPLQRQVSLVTADAASDLKTVAQTAREMLATHPRLCALLGFSDTDFVLATAPLAAKQRIPFLTPGATSPRLPKEVPNYLFLAAFGDNVQAAAAAEFARNELKAKTAYLLVDESTEYTRLLQDYFKTRFQELGGEIVGTQAFSPDQLEKLSLKQVKADVIFFSAGPQEALSGIHLMRKQRVKSPILGGDAFDNNELASAKDVRDVYFTTHAYLGDDNTRPAVLKFRHEYATRFPSTPPDAFAALGYDTVNLILEAIRKANSAEPERIREALAAMQGFVGVTGTISYTSESRIPTKTVSVVKVDKGKTSLAKEIVPQSVPSP